LKSEWIEKDRKYLWHPYTHLKDAEKEPPILIEKAQGAKLYDNNGNFYYDTISSWWCNVHGHGHSKIKRAIRKQLNYLEHVLFAGFTHKPAIRLAEALVSIAPKNLKKVFYSDNGSTAVECALKIAFQYWKNKGVPSKEKFVSLDHGYHGDTIGSMSVSGVEAFNEIFSPLFFKSYKAPAPYCYRCPMKKERASCAIECLGPLEEILAKNADNIAALIMEPMILAAGGMIVYPVEYLKSAAALARKYGVHLILDEVATGFGRTGKMFAVEHAGIEPDFICLSKGLTSGYLPLAATLTTDEVYKAFYGSRGDGKTFYHGHTYTANPVACRVAITSLKIFNDDNVLERIGALAPKFHEQMERFRGLKYVGDVRYIGMIGAIELVKNKTTKEGFDPSDRVGQRVYAEGLKKNLILRPLGDIIYFYLPYCMTEEEIRIVTDSAYNIISELD